MTPPSFSRNNHYVPQGYLKRWASSQGRVSTYRLLVSHPQVPLWKENSPRGVAYHAYLYTRLVAGGETDEIERWLNQEFETPAEEALQKATSNERMKPADWEHLIRFFAAQDVRTPARLAEDLQRWDKTLPSLIEDSLREGVLELESAAKVGKPLSQLPLHPYADHLPLRIKVEEHPDQEFGTMEAEMLAGRGLWLFGIRQALTQTVRTLLRHHWTVLQPPEGLEWFTSDSPVIRLNFHNPHTYDFKGGWGSPGTDLMLPLSPRHLLYTQVGVRRPPLRGKQVPYERAQWIRRIIAEHAHRMIFASHPDQEIPRLRPRTVNAALLHEEKEFWNKWHAEQTAAERQMTSSRGE